MPSKPATPAAAPAAEPVPAPAETTPQEELPVAAAEVDERKLKIRAAFAIFDPENTGNIPEE